MICFIFIIIYSPIYKAFIRPDSISFHDEMYEVIPDDSYDHNDYFYKIYNSIEHPININTCTLNELLYVPLMSFETATAIISYRNTSGKIFSTREILMAKDIDTNEVKLLLPFLTTGFESSTDKKSSQKSRSPVKASLISRTIYGTEAANIYGNGLPAVKTLTSTRIGYTDAYIAGGCIEKDAGERNLADYKSFYFRANSFMGADFIILGDYTVEFGKGLLIWTPYRQIQTDNVSSPQMGFGTGIHEHSGTSESLFLRGVALGFNYNYFHLDFFTSSRSIDASLDSTGALISYIDLSGYHRTATELSRQSSAKENITGGILSVTNYHSYELKLLLQNDRYSAPMAQKLQIAQNSLSGSASFTFRQKAMLLNGECGYNNQKYGCLLNLKAVPLPTSTLIISYRYYQPSFLGIHSSAVGRNFSNAAGEEGCYTGLRLLYRDITLNTYADFARSLAADRYGMSYTTSEYSTSCQIKSSTGLLHKIAMKFSVDEYPKKGFSFVTSETKTRFITWYDLNVIPDKQLQIKTRVGYAIMRDSLQHNGMLTYVQVKFAFNRSILISGRVYFYNSADYESGFYISESEVPGYVITSHLYNDGVRYCLMVSTILQDFIHISFKAASQRNFALNQNKYAAQYSVQCELRY
jgi:hypothetical protein